MPTSGKEANDSDTVQMPRDLYERFVAALESIAAAQTVEAAAEVRMAWMKQLSEDNATLQTRVMAGLVEHVERMYQPPKQLSNAELTLDQRQAALRYDAFRTRLGRAGAAALVIGVQKSVDYEDPRHRRITITQGQLPGNPLRLVAFSTSLGEIGRGDLHLEGRGPLGLDGVGRAADVELQLINGKIPNIDYFEIRDLSDVPIRLGLLDTSTTDSISR